MDDLNQYIIYVYSEQNGLYGLWLRVQNLNKFAEMLSDKFPTWGYFIMYDVQTGKLLSRFSKGEFIPESL